MVSSRCRSCNRTRESHNTFIPQLKCTGNTQISNHYLSYPSSQSRKPLLIHRLRKIQHRMLVRDSTIDILSLQQWQRKTDSRAQWQTNRIVCKKSKIGSEDEDRVPMARCFALMMHGIGKRDAQRPCEEKLGTRRP